MVFSYIQTIMQQELKKTVNDFTGKSDFKDIKCTSVFGYKNTEQFPAYVTKNAFKKHVCSVLIEKEDQSYYVLFEDFNMFLFNQTLHRDRKHFCC